MTATLPTLPATISDTTYSLPTSGSTIYCYGDGGADDPYLTEFQAALNAATPGDVLILKAGETYTGNYAAPPLGAGDPAYVISSSLANLPEGTRVGPGDTANMPKITSGAASTQPALTIENHATDASGSWRFAGLEIASDYAIRSATCYTIIRVGYRSAMGSDYELVVTDDKIDSVIIDRCYVHGTLTGNVRDGIVTYCVDECAVIESYIDDIHVAGTEAKGVWLYTGTGPMLVRNNFIQAAGQCVFIYDSPATYFYFTGGDNNGGADPVLDDTVTDTVAGGTGDIKFYRLDSGTWSGGDAAGLIRTTSTYNILEGNPLLFTSGATATCGEVTNQVGLPNTYTLPADVTISGNTLTKKIIWFVDQPGYDGYAWTCKYTVEFKGANRVLLEGNRVSNSWYATDSGAWINVTSKGHYVTDVTVRRNYVTNCADGIIISGGFYLMHLYRMLVEDNVVYDQNNPGNRYVYISGPAADSIRDVTIQHNTFIEGPSGCGGSLFFNGIYGTPDHVTRLDFFSNIFEDGATAGISGNGASGNGYAAVAYWTTSHDFNTNLAIGTRDFLYVNNTDYINFSIEDTQSLVGFTDATFDDITDFRLLDSSDYYQTALGDKDYGADIDAVIAALAGESSSEATITKRIFVFSNKLFLGVQT